MQKVSYDVVRGLSPIFLAEKSPNALVAHPSLPVKYLKELISLAKARPGELNYASNSILVTCRVQVRQDAGGIHRVLFLVPCYRFDVVCQLLLNLKNIR